jgi:16S rRNA (uracil1498-N3)-methyltransferase
MIPVRALPRAFINIPELDPTQPIDLPEEEFKKFRFVLRLATGDEVALLPGDGTLIRARLDGRQAIPIEHHRPQTESRHPITLALGLPKPDALEDAIRMSSELGIAHIVLFPARRSVVKWEQEKLDKKLTRLNAIAREACEVAYRVKLPTISVLPELQAVLDKLPNPFVLSESDAATMTMPTITDPTTLVIGPEGGWDPKEAALIKNPITLGPRVLRVSTAVAAACTLALADR